MTDLANAMIAAGLVTSVKKEVKKEVKKTFNSDPVFKDIYNFGIVDFKTKRIKDSFEAFELKISKKKYWGKGMKFPVGKNSTLKVTVIGRKSLVSRINSTSTVRARAVPVKKTWVEDSVLFEEMNLDLKLVPKNTSVTSEIKFLTQLDDKSLMDCVLEKRKEEGYINKKLIQGGYVSGRKVG